MKEKPPKKGLFKYFQPIDITDVLGEDRSGFANIDEGLGYFAFNKSTHHLFLNRFNNDEIMGILGNVGLIRHLNSLGFEDIFVELDRDESLIHYLKLYYQKTDPAHLLIDLRVSESRFVPAKKIIDIHGDMPTLDMIVIEWLSSQNPNNEFTTGKPQLPGQKKPGLGCLSYMMDMMYAVGREVIKDGFMDIPDHMHGAIMYSKKFKFFNPVHEAILKAILRDLGAYSLLEISWGMITETIYEKGTGEIQGYNPSEQIFPVSRRMQKYYSSKIYIKKFKEVYNAKRYYLDYEKMVEKRNEIVRKKNVMDL